MDHKLQKQQSGLRIPAVPNFPLSSPITEEISSPSSSSEDRDAERFRPFDYLSKEVRREVHKGRGHNGPGLGKDDGLRGVVKTTAERPAELNLVTDFSHTQPKKRTDASAPAFVDLNDLKLLSKVREKERSVQKIKGVFRKRTSGGFHLLPEPCSEPGKQVSYGEVNHGVVRNGRFDEDLSPSDRPIVIGITVPVDDTGSQKEQSKELESACSQPTPVTPSIVITPAREDAPWNGLSQDYHRPRATSSVYSQPTPRLANDESEVPPVPAIPAFHSVVRNGDASSDVLPWQSVTSTKKQRSFSTGTLFEEDDSPWSARRSRSYSNESARKTLHRLSVNTEANRHQSQGWWTYLLSPLLSRSNTLASRKTTLSSPDRPPMPSLTTDTTGSSDNWWEKEVSAFSPDTPETAVTSRVDMDAWPDGAEKGAPDTKSLGPEENGVLGARSGTSFMFPGYAIQGSAAEYYQACAHELFSGTPYFECINHVCSITPKSKIAAVNNGTSDAVEGDKGLVFVDVDTPALNQEGSRNLLVDDHSPSHSRSSSESTAIDDGAGSPNASVRNSTRTLSNKGSPIPAPRAVSETREPDSAPSNPPVEPVSHSSPPAASASAAPAPVTYIYYPAAPAPAPAPGPPPYLHAPAERVVPHYIAVYPPYNGAQPQEPDPTSPGLQQATERSGSIPLSDIQTTSGPAPTPTPAPAPASETSQSRRISLPPRFVPVPLTSANTRYPALEREKIETRRRRLEKEDAVGKRIGGCWRGRGPFSKNGCFGRPGREGRLRRRWYFGIALFFLIIIIVAVVLATTLTRKGDETPVESQWLNLTGYPPMPTGIATIAGPEAQVENSGCIKPSTLWSCALPKEEQSSNKPYGANQPNFRVEIRFRNGTYDNSTTVASHSTRSAKRYIDSIGEFLSRPLLQARSGELFSPSPSPPSIKDQTFIGNTTDSITAPYAGEETPFYMSILSPLGVSSPKLARRANNSSFPNLTSLIPSPDVDSDGTATAANLFPLPVSQPIRLYNRGLSTEHYGFYTYFDRSIFLESSAPLNGSTKDDVANDSNGGSTKDSARVRCTWSQTRFLVQIWTQPGRARMTLLSSRNATSSSTSATSSSATDFTRPGSFPYPVTVTLDRHGGSAKKKMVYCYGMDPDRSIDSNEKKLQLENRGFGGALVHPAPGIFNDTDFSTSSRDDADEGWGGIDGGTGGCSCRWANWIGVS